MHKSYKNVQYQHFFKHTKTRTTNKPSQINQKLSFSPKKTTLAKHKHLKHSVQPSSAPNNSNAKENKSRLTAKNKGIAGQNFLKPHRVRQVFYQSLYSLNNHYPGCRQNTSFLSYALCRQVLALFPYYFHKLQSLYQIFCQLQFV